MPEQQTEVKTKTHSAVYIGLTVTMLGAIAAGLAFALALPRSTTKDVQPTKVADVVTTEEEAMEFVDLVDAEMSADIPGDGVGGFNMVTFYGIDDGAITDHVFGTYPQSPNGYRDGREAESPLALKVSIDSITHQGLIITLRTTDNPIPLSKTNWLGVKEAKAQVQITDKRVICIPERTANPGSISASIYYVDVDGNVYWDQLLTDQVDSTSCAALINRTYSPNEIFNITASGPVDLGPQTPLIFAKSWETLLAMYSDELGFLYQGADEIDHAAPLFVIGGNGYEDPLSVPENTLMLETLNGTQEICMPAQTLGPDDWFVFFVDANGDPYSDMMLTEQIPCGGAINTCTQVSCKKFPNHACCIDVSEAASAE